MSLESDLNKLINYESPAKPTPAPTAAPGIDEQIAFFGKDCQCSADTDWNVWAKHREAILASLKELKQRREYRGVVEPFGYFCDWGDHDGLQRIAMYYGEPGSGSIDDWNEAPKVHRNLPLYGPEVVAMLEAARGYASAWHQCVMTAGTIAEIDALDTPQTFLIQLRDRIARADKAESELTRLRERLAAMAKGLRYWMPDETMIPKGHETAWNRHVELLRSVDGEGK